MNNDAAGAKPVFVYKGDALANYGFGDDHPFGVDRHEAFQAELANAGLGSTIEYAGTRRASVDELALFHSADYIDFISRKSAEGTGFLDGGDTRRHTRESSRPRPTSPVRRSLRSMR